MTISKSKVNKDLVKFGLNAFVTASLPFYDRALAPLLDKYPVWGMAWAAAIGLYNFYLFVEQDKVSEVVAFIQENPDKFTESIVKTDTFRSTFLKFLGEYLRQNEVEKREYLKQFLLGYIDEKEKKKYEFDRLTSTLSQISIEALENLIWIDREISPIVIKHIEEEMTKFSDQSEPREKQRLYDTTKQRQNISTFVHTWIHENYNPNSEKVKKEKGLNPNSTEEEKKKFNQERWLEEHEVNQKRNSHWAEYVSLGIVSGVVEGGGTFNGSGAMVYKLTSFGEKFIEYIKKRKT